MQNIEFIQILQKFTAVTAIGPSALRNQGGCVIEDARDYCNKINLKELSYISEKAFIVYLNKHTKTLENKFKPKKRWGAARKALNLFLRACCYNKYISGHYKLNNIEKYLEIPLDKAVTSGLRKIDKEKSLPRWKGIVNLTKSNSDEYQLFANKIARAKNINRVDLDMVLWLENR